MRWRIQLDRGAMASRKRHVAILELDADELDELATRAEADTEGQMAYDLRTAHSALLREEVEARR